MSNIQSVGQKASEGYFFLANDKYIDKTKLQFQSRAEVGKGTKRRSDLFHSFEMNFNKTSDKQEWLFFADWLSGLLLIPREAFFCVHASECIVLNRSDLDKTADRFDPVSKTYDLRQNYELSIFL